MLGMVLKDHKEEPSLSRAFDRWGQICIELETGDNGTECDKRMQPRDNLTRHRV